MFAALVLSGTYLVAQVATSPHTVSQVVDFWVTNTEQLVVRAADAMPEGKYSFAPSNGEFSGVRTFAEQVKHLAAAALDENNMDDPMPSKGNRTRLLMLIDAVVHSSNHYGQMVEYLRMNNIVPPASR